MCGIVSYIGKKDPVPILLKGLRRLEYRGYDSAGVALLNSEKLQSIKKVGKVSALESLIDDSPINGYCGIAHTRWATHGEPNDVNAHPHIDQTKKIAKTEIPVTLKNSNKYLGILVHNASLALELTVS